MSVPYSVVCGGYCRTTMPVTGSGVDHVQLPSSPHPHREGWLYVRDVKFDPRGRIVWICPKCVRRYEKEETDEAS